MRILLSFFLTLLVGSGLLAQCNEKVAFYGSDIEDILIHRIIRTTDGQFILVGQKNLDGLIMKVDDCGNLVWEKTHLFGTETGFRDVIDLGGKYVVMGYCTECKTGDPSKKFIIQELTLTGDKTGFPKTLGPSNADAEGYRMRQINGGRFALVGTRTVTQGQTTGNSMVAYLLDASYGIDEFQFFTQKKLGEIAYDIVEVPGTGFVIAGTSYQTTSPESSMIRLIGTNGTLGQLWSNDYFDMNTTLEQSARSIGRLPSGDLVFTGAKVEGGQQQLFVGKVNPMNGVLKGAATYGGSGDDVGRDIQVLDQENILISGLRVDAGVSEGPWGLVVDQWLAMRDDYQPAASGLFNSGLGFKEGNKQHFAFAGTAISFAFKGIFSRTNSLSTPLVIPGEPDARLSIYPNPTAGRIVLAGWDIPADCRISLFDAEGRQQWGAQARSEMTLPALPNGTYILNLQWSGGSVQQAVVLQR
ncbi:MAG: T9SS type A sorting domain-containing protein [Saprospiraceae bacterium]|nr:T9SS type A sorting domain-containing protein [Saprospiraceae bacterium]